MTISVILFSGLETESLENGNFQGGRKGWRRRGLNSELLIAYSLWITAVGC